MNMARHGLLLVILLVAAALAGCSGGGPTELPEGNDLPAAAFEPGTALSSSFTVASVTGMKGIAETEQLQLFVDDQTGAVAVRHQRSGEIWHSNPPERDTDPIAAGTNKGLLSAQLKIDYYNSFGQIQSINSHSDSAAFKQMKFEPIEGGVRVTYQFGTAKKSAEDMPLMMSEKRFADVSGKLEKAGQRALMIAYKKDPDTGAYIRNDSALNGLQLDRALQALADSGYSEEDLQADMAELNFTQEKAAPRIFYASIEYRLEGDSLVVHVPVEDIRYPAEYPINMVSVLNFFGAGGPEEEGSIFVPDGSGALINFNNGKTKYPAYQQYVYGPDRSMETTEEAAREQPVRLPVFGIIREGGAMLGIIEQGASAATINADVAGKLNSYNYVYPAFYVINKGEVTLQANSQERTLPKFQERPMKSDYTVRYAFLSGEDADYAGMARYYQHYLMDSGGLPAPIEAKAAADPGLPFYLQLDGSITKQKHFVGIPYRANEALTTFDQAKDIVSRMQERGIEHIKLKYAGWFNGGLDHKVPNKVKVDGVIGGSRGLRDFVSYAREEGIELYPDAAIVTALSGAGFDEKDDASRTLRGLPASLYPLDLALNRRDRSRSPSYAVSPRLVERYTDRLLRAFDGYDTGGISLQDLADQVNSDFRKNKQIDRTESEAISAGALRKIGEANLKVMADGGNAYALPYVTDIVRAPLSNSGFKLEDEAIPFYQMVIRGHIGYTGAPYNLSAYTNEKQYVLRLLEYGAGVHFEWIHAPNHKVKDTEFNHLYAVNYEQWLDQAADIYHEVNDVLGSAGQEPIVEHTKLADGVFKTVYGNGMYVIVNYNSAPVTIDGSTIEAESYKTGGEQA